MTINFANPEDRAVIRRVIEALGMDVSYQDESDILIPDDILKRADKNYQAIIAGKRKTKSWTQVKVDIAAKNG